MAKKPQEMPDKLKGLLKAFVTTGVSESMPCEEIKIHAMSKHASGEKYKCSTCDKDIDGVPIMATALIDEMKPFTTPNPPRFVFHVQCLPKFTKRFNDNGFDTAMKKHYPNVLNWFDHKGVVPWNKKMTPLEAVEQKPKPPAWEPIKIKKKPLAARLKKL